MQEGIKLRKSAHETKCPSGVAKSLQHVGCSAHSAQTRACSSSGIQSGGNGRRGRMTGFAFRGMKVSCTCVILCGGGRRNCVVDTCHGGCSDMPWAKAGVLERESSQEVAFGGDQGLQTRVCL